MSIKVEDNILSSIQIGDQDPSREIESKPKKVVNPPDCGWSWVVVVACFFVTLLGDGVMFSFGVITPEFITHFDLSRSTVGWMGSLLIAITLMTGPLASFLSEKFSYRSVSIAGSIIAGISFALPYFYDRVWFLFLTSSILTGLGFGLVYLPTLVIINVWFEKKRSLALGIAICGSGLGTFIFSPLLEFMIVTLGWQLTMLITGGILLLMIPCCWTFKDRITGEEKEKKMEDKVETAIGEEIQYAVITGEEKEDKKEDKVESTIEKEIQDVEMNADNDTSEDVSPQSYFELLKNPILWLFLISNVMTSIGYDTPYIFTKDRAIVAGIEQSKASYLISAIGIGNCAGKLFFGFLSTFKWANRFHVFNVALIVSGLVLVLSWFIENYILMVAYNLVFGFMSGPYMTLLSVLCVDMFGMANLDKTLAVTLVFQGIAVLVGPPISGWIFDVTDSFNVTFAVCGIFITLSGIIMYLAYISKDFRKKKFQ